MLRGRAESGNIFTVQSEGGDAVIDALLRLRHGGMDRPAKLLKRGTLVITDRRVLGAETFRLVSLKGQEKVSEHFEFQLELHGNSDYRQPSLAFDELMGNAA